MYQKCIYSVYFTSCEFLQFWLLLLVLGILHVHLKQDNIYKDLIRKHTKTFSRVLLLSVITREMSHTKTKKKDYAASFELVGDKGKAI